MKKLLFLSALLTTHFLSAQEISLGNFDNDFGIIETIVLSNGNKLNFSIDNLDNNTADSDCQCENIFFGDVMWVFETNNNFEIINQQCFTREDLLQLFYIDLPIPNPDSPFQNNTVYDNRSIWDGFSCPSIRDVFYLDNEIFVHFLEDYSRVGGIHTPTGASQLLKFDLSSFSFHSPIHYPTYYNSNYYGIIDKIIKLNETQLIHMYHRGVHTDDTGTLNSTSLALYGQGYQNFMARKANDDFRQLEVTDPVWGNTSFLNINEIFQANADVVVLDYKKNSENNISFLVVTNALDGLYTNGVQYETSLFLIGVDFTNLNNLTYNVVKSDLEIPRNISLNYGDYNVFINEENNYVINAKPIQYESETWDFYNSIHILSDSGGFETISLDNEYSVQWEYQGQNYYIGNPYNSSNNVSASIYSPHKIIDIAFAQDTFMTLEVVRNYIGNLSNPYGESRIIKLFNYDGTVLFRHIFSIIGPPGQYDFLFNDSFVTHTLDDISYLSGDVGVNYIGLKYNEISGYSIDTSAGGGVCIYDHSFPLWQFSFDTILSSSNFDNHSFRFNLKQNPVTNKLNIEGLRNLDLCIFNSLGQRLIDVKSSNSIDVSHLSKGVYFVRGSDGINSSTKKFIKN
jgi:hypothetical protein